MKFSARRWFVVLFAAGFLATLTTPPLSADPKGEKKAAKKKNPDSTEHKKGKKPAPKGFKHAPREKTRFLVDDTSSRNEVTFTSKAPKETIVGKCTLPTGELSFNPRNLKEVEGSITVPWSSLDTGHPGRNDHMRNPPWVDANAHPDIVFTAKSIESLKAGNKDGSVLKGKLVGTMAMNGVEKEMKIPVTLAYIGNGKGKDTEANDGEEVKEGIGIQAKFSVKLADFNIEGKGIGKAVAATQQIKVSLFLKRDVEPEPQEPTATPEPRPRTRKRAHQR